MSRSPRSQQARRYWGDDDSATPILHVDMDAFYASVEIMDNPELAGKPIAVGGLQRGVVSAASYEARAWGVNSAMPVAQAYRVCPQLVMLPVRMERYREVSEQIMAIMRGVTPLVEQLSVDEAFLDVGGAYKLFGSPVQIGTMIRTRIREEVGVPASVGIAATKHVAKIASAHAKPDGLLLIPASATRDFLNTLPVGALWGVGEKTRARLELQGISTVSDVVSAGEDVLIKILGVAHGQHIYDLACGRDARHVVVEREEKSMGSEQTLYECVHDRKQLERILLAQSHECGVRLRRHGYVAGTVVVKIRFSDFMTITRSYSFSRPTDLASDIYEASKNLLESVDISPGGVRLLGVRVQQLHNVSSGVQLMLGDDGKKSQAEEVMDEVRGRFGMNMVSPAALLKNAQCAESGGQAERET